jgi:basic membrane protein A
MSKKVMAVLSLLMVLAMVLAACGAAPEPETIIETVIVEVEKEVEKQVEVEVTKEVEVIKEVEVEAPSAEAGYAEFLGGKKYCAIFPGPVNDAGWTTAAYLGMINMRDNYGMDIAYREHVLPEETSDALREYAEAGCDALHAHGFEYFDQINEVSAEYPDKQFTQTSRGTGQDPNVIGLSFVSGEEGYFAGMAACMRSQTGKVGWVVGQTYPNLQWNQEQALVAFQDLVDAGLVDEPCEVEWLEVGRWDDPAKAKELTAAAIEQGIDTFVMVADAGDPGIVEAIEEAREAGKEAWAVSGVKDKNYLGPEFVIGGYEELVLMQMELALKAWADNGAPLGKDMPVGMREGAITWAPTYGLLSAEQEAFLVDVLECYLEEGTDCEKMGDVQFRTDL